MTKLLFLWLVATCTCLAGITNTITGAFGVKLGEPLTSNPGEIISRDGPTYVRGFTPDAPIAPFEKYEATLLKDGDVVVMVVASRGKLPKKESKAQFDRESARLAEMYGKPQIIIADDAIEITGWTNTTHSITLYHETKQDGNASLNITYLDERLAEKVRKAMGVTGTSTVTGAFGVTLGEPFETSRATKTFSGRDENSYLFVPANGFAPLITYVASTPAHTNVVFQISGYSGPLDWAEGKAAHDKLESGLRSKYGNPTESAKEKNVLFVIWENGPRKIEAFLLSKDDQPGKFNLGVSYTDTELKKSLKASKPAPDTSGL